MKEHLRVTASEDVCQSPGCTFVIRSQKLHLVKTYSKKSQATTSIPLNTCEELPDAYTGAFLWILQKRFRKLFYRTPPGDSFCFKLIIMTDINHIGVQSLSKQNLCLNQPNFFKLKFQRAPAKLDIIF